MTELNFGDYVKLHERGYKIQDMKPLKNDTYKVFASATNIDIRVINRDASYDLLVKLPKLAHFTTDKYGVSNKYFYSLPIQAPSGDYVGFVYRNLFSHDYASIYKPFTDKVKRIPYMFGFYKNFDDYDKYTSCMPIVVCEGIKDALVLRKLYPYVLANNTSALRININILTNITDKIILAYDNDETGHKESKKDKRKLSQLGCSVDILKYDDEFKDAGDYINHPEKLKLLKQQLKLRVLGLCHGTVLAV